MQDARIKISILGIGWLGFPLAKRLIEMGYDIKGSTTSNRKLEMLQACDIKPFRIELSENEIKGNMEEFLGDSEILIINIPPKLRGDSSENFVVKMKLLIAAIEKSTIKNILFVSSTSVYADAFPIAEIDENSTPNPDSESGKQLVETEKLLLRNISFQTTILRFGGLIGEDRHPIKFLAGKSNVENPDAPVNLIHQDDCIAVIIEIIKQFQHKSIAINSVFNAVAPQHPTRKEYYTKKALKLNLPLPTFAENSVSRGKIIYIKKLVNILGYSFQKEI